MSGCWFLALEAGSWHGRSSSSISRRQHQHHHGVCWCCCCCSCRAMNQPPRQETNSQTFFPKPTRNSKTLIKKYKFLALGSSWQLVHIAFLLPCSCCKLLGCYFGCCCCAASAAAAATVCHTSCHAAAAGSCWASCSLPAAAAWQTSRSQIIHQQEQQEQQSSSRNSRNSRPSSHQQQQHSRIAEQQKSN